MDSAPEKMIVPTEAVVRVSDTTTRRRIIEALSPTLRLQMEIHRRFNGDKSMPEKLHRAVCAELAGAK